MRWYVSIPSTIQVPGSPSSIDNLNQDTTVFTIEQADPNSQTKDESDMWSLFSLLETIQNHVEQNKKSWGTTNKTATKLILKTLQDQFIGY